MGYKRKIVFVGLLDSVTRETQTEHSGYHGTSVLIWCISTFGSTVGILITGRKHIVQFAV